MLSTRTPPSFSDTVSLNRSETSFGAGATCAPSAGVVETSCAWADAGAAAATRTTTTSSRADVARRSAFTDGRYPLAWRGELLHHALDLIGRELTTRPCHDLSVAIHPHEVWIRLETERGCRIEGAESAMIGLGQSFFSSHADGG